MHESSRNAWLQIQMNKAVHMMLNNDINLCKAGMAIN